MCGIVGYVGEKKAAEVLIDGLSKLEYRGYDSSGVALLESGAINVVKCKGRLACLEEKLSSGTHGAMIGIGHTRWATHGEPNDVNSHPHLSQSGRIAVVHNGIIENYMELKTFLQSKGFKFVSETDTEVVAHLVDYYYKGNLVESVIETLAELEGSYALGVIAEDMPGTFVAARKDSPLIVGLGKNENFIASDIPAILKYTRDIYILEDKEIAVLTQDSVQVMDIHGEPVSKDIFRVDWDVEAAEKGGYEHFMMKEMMEEPRVIRDTLSPRLKDGGVALDDIHLDAEVLKNISKISIIACGTAYHAGMVGKYLIEKLARIPVEIDVASEFRYREPIVDSSTLCVIISQSGETLDTMAAMKEAKRLGARTFAIVNVVGSSIARNADDVLYTWAGPEIAVASTKAYNTQLAALNLLALHLASAKGLISKEKLMEMTEELKKVPSMVESVLNQREEVQRFAAAHFNAQSIFFIGRGLDYALSMEGSLKLKEVSYIHSEAYAGGELKHGTIALIEEGTLVVCPITQDALVEKMVSNIREVKARGAVIMAVTPEKHVEMVSQVADSVIVIPDVDPLIAPITAVTPMQLFAYYMAVARGCDVDKPRNLAKSVTVE